MNALAIRVSSFGEVSVQGLLNESSFKKIVISCPLVLSREGCLRVLDAGPSADLICTYFLLSCRMFFHVLDNVF